MMTNGAPCSQLVVSWHRAVLAVQALGGAVQPVFANMSFTLGTDAVRL